MIKVNIGCGPVFHADWINLDAVSQSDMVVQHDVRYGLPFEDSYVSVCYSAHLLEHLLPKDAESFLLEVFRVLKPGGVVRLVVPDLELLTKNYLEQFNLSAGNIGDDDDYDWTVIQLIDQMVRHTPGGEMSKFFRDLNRNNDQFVSRLAGPETEVLLRRKAGGVDDLVRSLWVRLRSKGARWFIRLFREKFALSFVKVIAGREAAEAFKIGLFRNSGEVHQWMYDRYSLSRILLKAGFDSPRSVTAFASEIPDFNSYDLDVIDGLVRKPDSLYMEAIKIR